MRVQAPSIEDVILRYDRRQIGRLRECIGTNFCGAAADFVVAHSGPVLIATGFYIAHAEKPETDGPPGAIALARGFEALGRRVEFVTDAICADMLGRAAEGRPVHVVPINNDAAAKISARSILAKSDPGLLVAIERCGPDAEGRFLQFDGTDITNFTGRLESLFQDGVPSIGIVDGGNEIGIGGVADTVKQLPGLPNSPCVVATDRIVLGTVANWGAYGLLAALSLKAGKRVVPTALEETNIRASVVAAGAIDGVSGEAIGAVDGYPSELNSLVIERLHRLIDR